jgi:Trk-type K+ transport system membrane component
MPKLIVLLLLGVIAFPILLQGQVYTDKQKTLYENKVYKFTKMKRTGFALTVGGVAATVAGIMTMSNSGYINSYHSIGDQSVQWLVGYITTIVGIEATAGGITLWSIGNSKAKSYNKRLNSLSLNLNPAPKQMISLSYRL